MVLRCESLSWETWKMGCTDFIVLGSQSVKEWVPIRKGPHSII